MGIEPMTYCLKDSCSTAELILQRIGWELGTRTPIKSTKNFCPTIRRIPSKAFCSFQETKKIEKFWKKGRENLTKPPLTIPGQQMFTRRYTTTRSKGSPFSSYFCCFKLEPIRSCKLLTPCCDKSRNFFLARLSSVVYILLAKIMPHFVVALY